MIAFHYLKFTLFHLLSILTIIALLIGGDVLWISYVLLSLMIILGDAFLGDDSSKPNFRNPALLNIQLFMALPLLIILMFVGIWSVSPTDTFGFGAWLSATLSYDFVAAKQNTVFWQHAFGVFYVGLMSSMIGTAVGHELVHRSSDKLALLTGRWLLAFSFDSNFSIEHVYGHHRYAATNRDPATAPRGRNVYQHIIQSTVEGNISAWNIEKTRLARRNTPLISVHNIFIRGLLMSITIGLGAFYLGSWAGLSFFIFSGLWTKAILEIVNYMEHYGLVRMENKPVEPRHSWNTNKKVSSWSLFNLSRHSHHHAQAHVPFHRLKPYPNAPMMLSGYLGTMSITLIPPLWFKLMQPKLEDWDKNYASHDEKALVNA